MKIGLPSFGKPLIAALLFAALVGVAACSATSTTVTTTVTQPPTTITATPSDATLAQLKEIAGPPPASLDQYFPPKAPAPVYLIEMFTMATPFEGIGVDLQEGDIANAKANFQAFQTEYSKVSKMVPEWTTKFQLDPVNALGTAINGGNPAQIGQAMGGVGQVCSNCHLINQVKVEQKYAWNNFDNVKVTNPITNQSMTWVDYMTAMAGAYTGTTVDLQQGKLDKARQNFQAFNAEFNQMAKDGCKQCHTDPITNQEIPRKYFVDSDSMALIAQMGQALSAPTPDATSIGNLNQAIGNGICVECHLVHLPAQTSKDIWDQYGDLFK